MTRLAKVVSRARLAWFAAHGARFGAGCSLDAGVSIRCGVRNGKKGEIVVGPTCDLQHGCCLHAWGGRIALGREVFIGPYAVLYGQGGIEVGENSLISMHCRILSSNHAIPEIGIDIRSQADDLRPVTIGRDVWLGAGVSVLGGVTIGDGCVVGAGAVVASDVPAYSVAVGVPAVVVRARRQPSQTA